MNFVDYNVDFYLHSLKESAIHSLCHVSMSGGNNFSFKQFRGDRTPVKDKYIVENPIIA